MGSSRANTIHAEDGATGSSAATRSLARGATTGVKGSGGTGEVYGGPGDDLVRGGIPERPNDGARDVLDCGEGTDTACYVEDQDTVRGCMIASPSR